MQIGVLLAKNLKNIHLQIQELKKYYQKLILLNMTSQKLARTVQLFYQNINYLDRQPYYFMKAMVLI